MGFFGQFSRQPGANSTLPWDFRRQEIVLRRSMSILSVQTLDPVSSCSEWAMCGLRSWKWVNMVHWFPCLVYVKRPLDFLLCEFCIWVTSGFQSLSGCVGGCRQVRGMDWTAPHTPAALPAHPLALCWTLHQAGQGTVFTVCPVLGGFAVNTEAGRMAACWGRECESSGTCSGFCFCHWFPRWL